MTTKTVEAVGRRNHYMLLIGIPKLTELAWKPIDNFLKNLKLELPCDPTILLLGIYLKIYKSA